MHNPQTVFLIGGLLFIVYAANMGFLQSTYNGLLGTCPTCQAGTG